ncbi:uncharacterized protein [Rutidosis leptorrhynchoides]|uniref:uncharacterized protein n=1 Tax=Rutidosis leptorrhynchoides TaxID=125765 RepID=UPI003A99D8E8
MESKLSSLSIIETTHQTVLNSGTKSTPSSVNRLWRPAAQRNMKNQWSRLNSLRQEWFSSSSAARSHATSLVNAYLSQRYMKDMELGVLSDMPDIQKKACSKLLKQQVVHRDKLLSSYKEMVATVVNMVNISSSLRCFHQVGTNSSHIRFSSNSEDANDEGDGGGVPLYTFWSISCFEKLALELVQMFKSELYLKRLLVIEFLPLKNKDVSIIKRLSWCDEIYQGEFDDLRRCNFDHKDPKLDGCCINETLMQPKNQPDSDVLQIYLTAWLTDVNIDKQRMEDIFSEVGEEMHTNFLS